MSTVTIQEQRPDNRPLNEREKRLVQRLLSDPFSFPQAFKSWHVRSLESSDLSITMSNVVGLTDTLGLDADGAGALGLLNTGCCVVWAGAGVPPDSLLCDGSTHPTADQPDLFGVIGYGFGGSGANFNVPNIPAPAAGLKWVIVT